MKKIVSGWQPDLPGLEFEDLSYMSGPELADYFLSELNVPIEVAQERLSSMGHDYRLVDLGRGIGKYLVDSGAETVIDDSGFDKDVPSFLWDLSDNDLYSYMESLGMSREGSEWADVDIAYHATTSSNAESIEIEGILTVY